MPLESYYKVARVSGTEGEVDPVGSSPLGGRLSFQFFVGESMQVRPCQIDRTGFEPKALAEVFRNPVTQRDGSYLEVIAAHHPDVGVVVHLVHIFRELVIHPAPPWVAAVVLS